MEYGAPFAPNGRVDACSRNGTTGGCGRELSFGVANTRTAEYHAQNTRLKCGVEVYRERELSPHHCGKETIGGVLPSGGKQTDAHPLLTQASPPSGGSRGSRKRARHSEITSTAAKRAIGRESTGGAVTMPDIHGQKSPVNRNSAMKTEVQLYWEPGKLLHVTGSSICFNRIFNSVILRFRRPELIRWFSFCSFE